MNKGYSYLKNMWELRYFSLYLALSDLKSRWRRSFFGILWCMIQPLGMTLLLSFVLSRLFNIHIKNYAPYILSGMIVWEFIMSCVNLGALSFLTSANYIKQCKHPLAIYTLRTIINAIIILILASIPLFCWVLVVMPENFNISWISLLVFYPLLILMFWPAASYLAYVATRFRDLVQALTLIMQALWFISPIYLEEKMFRSGNLNWLVDYNPLYHLLELIRAPLLKGQFPSLENYYICVLTILILTIIAIVTGVKSENKVIHYL